MKPSEFVAALARGGGMEFADQDEDFCSEHGWLDGAGYAHAAICEKYADKLRDE